MDVGFKMAIFILEGRDVHFFETYIGTPRAASLRTFWNLVAQCDLDDCKMDVEKAFSRNPMDCLLYCELPEAGV